MKGVIMDKSEYMCIFNDMSNTIKFNTILKSCDVDSGAFSRFINGQENAISLEACQRVYYALGVFLKNSYNIQYQKYLTYSYR